MPASSMPYRVIDDCAAAADDAAAETATAITLTLIFLFFICVSLSGVVFGLVETGYVVFECR